MEEGEGGCEHVVGWLHVEVLDFSESWQLFAETSSTKE